MAGVTVLQACVVSGSRGSLDSCISGWRIRQRKLNFCYLFVANRGAKNNVIGLWKKSNISYSCSIWLTLLGTQWQHARICSVHCQMFALVRRRKSVWNLRAVKQMSQLHFMLEGLFSHLCLRTKGENHFPPREMRNLFLFSVTKLQNDNPRHTENDKESKYMGWEKIHMRQLSHSLLRQRDRPRDWRNCWKVWTSLYV